MMNTPEYVEHAQSFNSDLVICCWDHSGLIGIIIPCCLSTVLNKGLCDWTSTSLTFPSSTLLLCLSSLFSSFSSHLHCAPECHYPIYMQNDASDAFVTEVHKGSRTGDKDGQERSRRMDGWGRRRRRGSWERDEMTKTRMLVYEWMKKTDGKWQLSNGLEDK